MNVLARAWHRGTNPVQHLTKIDIRDVRQIYMHNKSNEDGHAQQRCLMSEFKKQICQIWKPTAGVSARST